MQSKNMKQLIILVLFTASFTTIQAQLDPLDSNSFGDNLPIQIQVISNKPINCPLADNGSIALRAIGGESPYDYVLDGDLHSTNGFFGGLSEGKHNVFITDSLGQTTDIDFVIKRSYATVDEECPCTLFIPTALTANVDGVNDLFDIIPNCPLVDFELRIYDRWGNKVFETYDYKQKWNAGSNFYYVSNGIYNYTIKYRWGELLDINVEVQTATGIIHVLR